MKYDRNHKDGDKCPDLKSIYKVELTGLMIDYMRERGGKREL